MFARILALLGLQRIPTPAAVADVKAQLRGLLDSETYRFRSLSRLSRDVPAGVDVVALLREIGARPARNNPALWTLQG